MEAFETGVGLLREFLSIPSPPSKFAKKKREIPIDWELGEKLYIEGELQGDAEHTIRVYPSYSQLARRIGTSKENVQNRIMRYKWREKREEYRIANSVVDGITPNARVQIPEKTSRKRSRRSAEQILLEYLDHFSEAVRLKQVRFDTVADLDKAVRLLAFVRGQHESTKTVRHVVSLDTMQARHREHRAHLTQQLDDNVAGVLTTEGVDVEVQGELVSETIVDVHAHLIESSRWEEAERRASAT